MLTRVFVVIAFLACNSNAENFNRLRLVKSGKISK